jgi:hypothetical protein
MKNIDQVLYSLLITAYLLIIWVAYQLYMYITPKIVSPISNEKKIESFYRYQRHHSSHNQDCWFAIRFEDGIFQYISHSDHDDNLKQWLMRQNCIEEIYEGEMIAVLSNQNKGCQINRYTMSAQDKLVFQIIEHPHPKLCFTTKKTGVK